MRRQTETQQIVGPLEAPAPDVMSGKQSMYRVCIGALRKSKQTGSTCYREARSCQYDVELACLMLNLLPHALCPCMIAQGGGADGQGRSGARPWTERQSDAVCDLRMRDGKAQPQPGETVELSKGTQND